MTPKKLTEISASELVSLIKQQTVSAREVIQTYIDRIEQVNPKINALIQVDFETALKKSDQIDEDIQNGSSTGKLAGLPITIKDTCNVKGFKHRRGSKALPDVTAEKDDTLVKRLRDEGAIILGISNTPELLSSYETDNDLYGRTNNPYDLSRIAGGSSGGEAAIIAAGGSALGIGSDAGGSIRQPAHCTGICGIKPTQFTIPMGHPSGIFHNILCNGPMARFVKDLQLVLPIISGPDGIDPYVPPLNFTCNTNIDLTKLRVAYYSDNGIIAADKDTVNIIKLAIDALNQSVASVTEARPPLTEKTHELLWEVFMQGGDAGQWQKEFLELCQLDKPSALFSKAIKNAEGVSFSVTELRNRFYQIDDLRFQAEKFMQNFDVIICPTTATVACKHGETHDRTREMTYASYYNLLGYPAVTVRGGKGEAGMPIGLQVISRAWKDNVALAVAAKIEELLGGYQAPNI